MGWGEQEEGIYFPALFLRGGCRLVNLWVTALLLLLQMTLLPGSKTCPLPPSFQA